MRPLDSTTQSVIAADVTAPRYLVRLGFETPLTLTTTPVVTWQGETYAPADLRISPGPLISVFNDSFAFGANLLAQDTAGKSLRIWQLYADPLAFGPIPGHTEPVMIYEGVVGDIGIDDYIQIRGRDMPVQYTPRRYAEPPIFNHLPKSGMVIQMPGQKVIIE